MKLNRNNVTLGLTGLALVGAIVGGGGIALAATDTPPPTSTTLSADPPYGHGHMGVFGGPTGSDMAGMASGENSPIAAAAGHLGLSQADLQTQLRSGQSLADVAGVQGKSVSGLEDAMVAAMTSNLDANTVLTADQKAADLAVMKSHIDAMVNAAHSSGSGFGPMDAGMNEMMGR